MKSIEIEDDVYEFLLKNAVYIGESASEILRRLLNISEQQSENEKNDIKIDSSHNL